MNTANYRSPEQEERAQKTFAQPTGSKLDEWFVELEAIQHDASEQVVVDCEMIWTMVNQ